MPVIAGEPWLLFQQFGGSSTVVLARPDGSDLHSPTFDIPGGDQTNPDWSPDGSTIVLAVHDGTGHEDLWIVRADGSDPRVLADCEGACLFLDDPDWSPDGRTVLYSRVVQAGDGSAVSTLEQVDVETGTIEVIVTATPGSFYAGQRWSPDGQAVVIEILELARTSVESEVVDATLAIIDPAAPTALGRALTAPGTFPETAAWGPGGDVIVFGALDAPGAPGTDLFAIHPDGSGMRRITDVVAGGGNATHPDVAADGRIAFSATLPGHGSVLAVVDLAGGEIAPALGDRYVVGVHPRWRPIQR